MYQIKNVFLKAIPGTTAKNTVVNWPRFGLSGRVRGYALAGTKMYDCGFSVLLARFGIR